MRRSIIFLLGAAVANAFAPSVSLRHTARAGSVKPLSAPLSAPLVGPTGLARPHGTPAARFASAHLWRSIHSRPLPIVPERPVSRSFLSSLAKKI
jgi:hypothetical protein